MQQEAQSTSACGRTASDQIVETYYGLLGDQETVVIEMAKANGIELVKAAERNPLITSTYGTGDDSTCAQSWGKNHYRHWW